MIIWICGSKNLDFHKKIAETITARQSNKVQIMEKLFQFLIEPPQGENNHYRNK
jgi:hypothetical protein